MTEILELLLYYKIACNDHKVTNAGLLSMRCRASGSSYQNEYFRNVRKNSQTLLLIHFISLGRFQTNTTLLKI